MDQEIAIPKPFPENNPAGTQQSLNSVGQLLSDSWRFYKERFGAITKLLIFPLIIMGVSWGTMQYGASVNVFAIDLLSFIGDFAMVIGVIAVVSTIARGTGFIESYRNGFRFSFELLWIGLLSGLAILGGYFMLIIPGIMMMVWFSFILFTVVVENKWGLNALTQSREWTRGYWWPIAWRMIMIWILTTVIPLAIFILNSLFLGSTDNAILSIISDCLFLFRDLFIVFFASPFHIVYLYKLYENLVVLKPSLSGEQSKSGRGFFKISIVLGILAPIALFITFMLFGVSVMEHAVMPSPDLSTASTTTDTTASNDNDAQRISDLHKIQTMLELYYAKCGNYPGGAIKNGVCPAYSDAHGYDGMVNAIIDSNLGVNVAPNDPRNNPNDPMSSLVRGGHYFYSTDGDGSYYILAALLDDKNNPIFSEYSAPSSSYLTSMEGTSVWLGDCTAPAYCVAPKNRSIDSSQLRYISPPSIY